MHPFSAPSASPSRPLPKVQLLVLFIVLFAEAYNLSSVFPYVYFLCRDLLPGVREEDLGYYVGLLVACFPLGQFISGTGWGRYADRAGRRRVLLLGLFFNSISIAVFGMSVSFPMAVLTRFTAGLLNGNVAAAKSHCGTLAEDVANENRSKIYSVMGLAFGLGGVLGPLGGGLLCRPADKYPEVFPPDSLFGDFPYLLPALVSVLVTLVGWVVGFFVLRDQHVRSTAAVVRQRLMRRRKRPQSRGRSSSPMADGDDDDDRNNVGGTADANDDDDDDDEVAFLPSSESRSSVLSPFASTSRHQQLNTFVLALEDRDHGGDAHGMHLHGKEPVSRVSVSKICLKDVHVFRAIVTYGMIALGYVWFEESMPLMMVRDPAAGGFGFSSNQIGFAQAISGAATIAFQLGGYHLVVERLGKLTTLRVGLLGSSILFFLFPFIGVCFGGDAPSLLWTLVAISMVLRSVVGACCFTTINMLLNYVCAAENLGVVNGVAQSCASFFRAVGPSVGGSLFALTVSGGMPFPLNWQFIFVLTSVLMTGTGVYSFRFDDSVERPRSENVEHQELLDSDDSIEDAPGAEAADRRHDVSEEEDGEPSYGEGAIHDKTLGHARRRVGQAHSSRYRESPPKRPADASSSSLPSPALIAD